MITADLHTHSSFSSDSGEPLFEMVNSAREKGLKTLCLTEHMDMDYPGGEFILDTENYQKEFLRVREQTDIELLFGVELGLMDYLAPKLYDYAGEWEFDFIIGSSHLVDGQDPYYPEYFQKLGSRNGILRYFESILANVKAMDCFDVYGHLDYVVRYSPEKSYDPVDHREIIDEILRLLLEKGKGIEINTAGLKSGLGYVHPHEFILNRYKELGGEIITVGSDAHDRSRIAADFDKAEAALKNAGFKYYTIFRERKPDFVLL